MRDLHLEIRIAKVCPEKVGLAKIGTGEVRLY